MVPEDETDDIDAFTDELMDQLVMLDPTADLHGSITTGEFFITVTVEAQETFDAIDRARALIRAAAHAAGANTASWHQTEDVWSWMLPTGPLHADPANAVATA